VNILCLENRDITSISVVSDSGSADGTSISGIPYYTASTCHVSSGSNANDSYIINKLDIICFNWVIGWFAPSRCYAVRTEKYRHILF